MNDPITTVPQKLAETYLSALTNIIKVLDAADTGSHTGCKEALKTTCILIQDAFTKAHKIAAPHL